MANVIPFWLADGPRADGPIDMHERRQKSVGEVHTIKFFSRFHEPTVTLTA